MTVTSISERCLKVIAETLEGMGLETLHAGDVKIREAPWDDRTIYTGITVHPVAEREWTGTTSRDDVGYGVGVTWVQLTAKGITNEMEARMVARQRIRRRFVNQRLPGIDEVFQCKIEYGALTMPKKYKDNYHCWQIVIRCWSREARTEPS